MILLLTELADFSFECNLDFKTQGLGFESQLDPGFFSLDLFLTLSAKNLIIHECLLSFTVNNIKPLN